MTKGRFHAKFGALDVHGGMFPIFLASPKTPEGV